MERPAGIGCAVANAFLEKLYENTLTYPRLSVFICG
jgi:hypothetical protein